MTPLSITVTDAARNFSDFVNRVTYRQECFFLVKGKKPVAELRPVSRGKRIGELPAVLGALPPLTPEHHHALMAVSLSTASEATSPLLSDHPPKQKKRNRSCGSGDKSGHGGSESWDT